jgi:hypothetical protein
VGETRDTVDIFVSIEKIVVTGVTKPLVPKEAFGVGFDAKNVGPCMDVLVKW